MFITRKLKVKTVGVTLDKLFEHVGNFNYKISPRLEPAS